MMLSWTSLLNSGSEVTNVSVCGMPVVLPVAALFSKTIVAGPATAVFGADVYSVMLSPAVQVSTCAAAASAVDSFSPAEDAVVCRPSIISRAASRPAHTLRFRVTGLIRPSSPADRRPGSGRRPCR